MTRRANSVGAINLGQGLSRIPPPARLLRELERTAREPVHSYGPAAGSPELRQAWARHQATTAGAAQYDPESELVATVGATGAYTAALFATTDPGDGVLLLEPFYSYHRDIANLLGLHATSVPGDPFDSHPITAEKLEQSIESSTRVIVLCTPNNPSGRTLNKQSIASLATSAQRHDLVVISDEIYQRMLLRDEAKHHSPATHPQLRDRTITICGLSKLLSVPGWRIGFAGAPTPLATPIAKAADLLAVCPPTPLQAAAALTLDCLDEQYFAEVNRDLTARRDVVQQFFASIGLPTNDPDGAYYLAVDCTSLTQTGYDAATKILTDHKIATIPGEAFHSVEPPRPWVRACFAAEDRDIERLTRMIP